MGSVIAGPVGAFVGGLITSVAATVIIENGIEIPYRETIENTRELVDTEKVMAVATAFLARAGIAMEEFRVGLQEQHLLQARAIAIIRNNLRDVAEEVAEIHDLIHELAERLGGRVADLEDSLAQVQWLVYLDGRKGEFEDAEKHPVVCAIQLVYDYIRMLRGKRLLDKVYNLDIEGTVRVAMAKFGIAEKFGLDDRRYTVKDFVLALFNEEMSGIGRKKISETIELASEIIGGCQIAIEAASPAAGSAGCQPAECEAVAAAEATPTLVFDSMRHIAGLPDKLKVGANFHIDKDKVVECFGNMCIAEQLPDGVEVKHCGDDWIVVGNSAGLSLKLRDSGKFDGDFQVYVKDGDKTRKTKLEVVGVMVGKVGYGFAFAKGYGAFAVTVE